MRIYRVIAFLGLCGVGCSGPKDVQKEDSREPVGSKEETIVSTYQVYPKLFNYMVKGSGKIKPENQQIVIAESNGQLTYYGLKNSEVVGAGQILLKFDTRAQQIKLEQVKENIFSSSLNYQSDLLSQESLLKSKSKGIRDTVYRKIKSSTGLTNAEIEMKDLQLEIFKSNLRAPFSGKIANIKVQPHQYVRQGDELFTIYTDRSLFLETKVLESDILSIRVGQKAEIQPIFDGSKYLAVVDDINPIVDDAGLVQIRLKLLNPKGLIAGMNAIATILIPEQKSLSVPKQAIVMRSGKAVVFTFRAGKAKWNYVSLGRDNGLEVEIKNGLQAGEKVILENNLQLAHDAVVKEQN
ncbi:MAG: efflux RND transporter periplasmic adaptor subunit [Chryseobacterium sp.]|nr:MAG: efflux RND transporter periplasmic adaptor subunit [Chryseobacterium sp.]